MEFKGKYFRNLNKVLIHCGDIKSIQLIWKSTGGNTKTWTRLGFKNSLNVGDYIIPTAIGKVTTFNSQGKELVRKDLPKEYRYVDSFQTLRDWQGNTYDTLVSRRIKAYPKDYVKAPSAQLNVINLDSELCISTDPVNVKDEDAFLHLCNLMLECFGSFEIMDSDNKNLIIKKTRTLQWEILPKGDIPWKQVSEYISNIKSLNQSQQGVVKERLIFLQSLKPDFFARGTGGFNGYFVYGYDYCNKYIMESAHLDNATYIFGDDWESLSKLTKNEIINGSSKFERVVHKKTWKWTIRSIMGK